MKKGTSEGSGEDAVNAVSPAGAAVTGTTVSTTSTAVVTVADTSARTNTADALKDMSDEELVKEALKELQKIKEMMGLL